MRLMTERRRNGKLQAAKLVCAVAAAIAVYCGMEMAKGLMRGEEPQLAAKSAILVDAGTGEVLFEQNADEPLPPASMSKMMTELLVLDRIHSGEISWRDTVRASGYAAAVPGARMGLAEGDTLTVRELFDAMTIHSANDAAVALAEHVGGTEAAFVELMNERAKRIGMSDETVFGNASGLSAQDIARLAGASHTRDTVMTARDTARLAGHLIGKYPEVLEVASRGSVQVSTSGQALAATNLMLDNKPFAYPGNDGLKTGYTPDAGYCFTGTVKRDGKRLISVVMGTDTSESRFVETTKLYKYGFKEGRLAELQAAFARK